MNTARAVQASDPSPPPADHPPLAISASWAFILAFTLWIAPFVGRLAVGDKRFNFLLGELACLAVFALVGRRLRARAAGPVYWAAVSLACLWLVAGLDAKALPGLALALLTVYCLGLLAEGAFMERAPQTAWSRASHFVRVPYVLALGSLTLVTVCSFLGIFIKINILFLTLPLVAIGGACWLRLRRPYSPSQGDSPPQIPTDLLCLAAGVPLLLAFHKYMLFYHFGNTGHAEQMVAMVNSIAQYGNFPVRFPTAAEMARQVIAPLDGMTFSPRGLIGAFPAMVQGTVFPGHYGGEVLSAFLQYLSGIHPYDAFRLTQVLTGFITLAWTAVMLAPLFSAPWASLLFACVLAWRLSDFHYSDRDLEVMGLMGLWYLMHGLGAWLAGRQSPGWSRTMIFLGIVLGCVLYSGYPGSFILAGLALVVVLALCLLFPRIMSVQPGTRRLAAHWPWLVVLLVLGAILLSQGLAGSLWEGRHEARSLAGSMVKGQGTAGQGHAGVEASGPWRQTMEGLKTSAAYVGQYLAGHVTSLCDSERYRRIPSIDWLLLVAAMLFMGVPALGAAAWRRRLYWALPWLLLLAFWVYLLTTIVQKRLLTPGAGVGVLMLAFAGLALWRVRNCQASERVMWVFLPLLMGGSLLASLIMAALSPGNLGQQYFMNPFEWGLNFMVAYAVASAWYAQPAGRWSRLVPLGLWLTYTADYWSSYFMFFVLKEVHKLSWALFFK